jgi:hypothetical protein
MKSAFYEDRPQARVSLVAASAAEPPVRAAVRHACLCP